MISKVFITAAIAAFASAQSSSSCSSSDGLTIQNQGDASAIGSCTTFTGDITINPQAGTSIDFGNVQSITGNLSMSTDSQIQSIKANSLTNLGSLNLNNLTSLSTLSMSSLSTVGDINLVNLAALTSFNFGSGLKSAGMVTIGNVQIQDLSGIGAASTLGGISLSNCQYLTKINFNVKKVGTVDIGPNNVVQGQQITFPNLQTADKLTFQNSTVVSTPSLTNVSDSLSLIGNKVTSYGAANLTWVGALIVQSNPSLSNLTFPQLITINGSQPTLDIENNTALTNINGFPKLVDVPNGDAIFAGNIKNLSLPSLTKIGGALRVLTTDANFDCSPIQAYHDNQTVLGDESCTNGDSSAIGTTNGTSTSSGSGSSSSSKSAAAKDLPTFLTTGAFAALLAFLA